jgi:hypothetical protein
MLAGDGTAITYSWDVYTRESTAQTFWNQPCEHNSEKQARDWCHKHGYPITDVRWS